MTPSEDIVHGIPPDVVFAKDQPEYIPLPAMICDGAVTTRWNLSWKERFAVLFGGSIWLQVMTFGKPLQPVKLSTECPIVSPWR